MKLSKKEKSNIRKQAIRISYVTMARDSIDKKWTLKIRARALENQLIFSLEN